MGRALGWTWLLCWLWACGESTAPPTPPAPSATEAKPVAPTPPPSTAPAAPAAANPCATPEPLTIEIEAGVIQHTPWGLEITYAIDEDAKRGPGYMFLLRNGARRWETRRDETNWTKLLTWRGFCWRGDERPGKRASHVKIDMAPVCKDGQLQELGGCGNTLGGS